MTHYVNIADVPRYPKESVSKQMTEVIQKDGLIEPLLAKRKDGKLTDIHPHSRERCEAFIREVEYLESEGMKATNEIIVVFWDELTPDEKAEYRRFSS